MLNPFTLKEVPFDGAFCNRENEQRDLAAFAKSAANVLLYSPRRYGKTSLVRRIQHTLSKDDTLTAYCDLFGVCSTDEIAGKIVKSIFSITRQNETIFHKAIRFLTSFRPVLSPSADGGVSISVQPAYSSSGIELLDETLEALTRFILDAGCPVHIVLDEFQEITEVENSLAIEGVLRSHIQRMAAAFVFVGSRRRLLLEMFNHRRRPFYQSAVAYELKVLPREELIGFITKRFVMAGKQIDPLLSAEIVDRLECHPYYTQKFCFFLFDRTQKKVSRDDLADTFQLVMASEKALFESILRRLTTVQMALLTAIAVEPTAKLYAAEYMKRHSLKSTGGVQLGLEILAREDLIERPASGGVWAVVDPLFREWLRRRAL